MRHFWGTKYSRIRSGRILAGWAASALSLWFCDASEAQEWKLDTSLSQQFLYSDNLLLGRQHEIDTFGSVTSPALRIERTSPTLDVSLDGVFDFAEYFNHSDFDSQDQLIRLNIDKAMSERSSLSLKGSFNRDTSLKSDLDETGKFVDEPIRYTTWDVRPSWTYLLTPVDQATLSGTYRSVTYDSSEKIDYNYFGGAIDYGHQLSEIDQVTGNLGYFRYEPDQPGDPSIDTFSGLLGYAYTPSDRLSIRAAAGAGYSLENSDNSGSNNDGGVGYRLKFSAHYDVDDRTSTNFSISHDSEPSSDGELVTRNRATIGINRKLTPYTTFALNLDYVDNFDYAGIEGDTNSDENETRYASVRPSLSWALTEEVSLIAEYRYRYKLYEDSNDAATGNSVFLTLKYELPTWAWDGY